MSRPSKTTDTSFWQTFFALCDGLRLGNVTEEEILAEIKAYRAERQAKVEPKENKR